MKSTNISLILIIILTVVLMFGCQTQTVAKTNNEPTNNNPVTNEPVNSNPTQKDNCKTVNIAYQENVEEKIDYKYQAINSDTSKILHDLDLWLKGSVGIKNTEKFAGNFTVEMTFMTTKGKVFTRSSTLEIMSNEVKYFKEEVDIDDNERFNLTYKVIPPKKIVNVNTVTKYRQEQQCS
ncbi:MAG: hypothetical protein WC755_03580 [Candidatus Woesearchaeota archaeon]|jgi:hypothetical protein